MLIRRAFFRSDSYDTRQLPFKLPNTLSIDHRSHTLLSITACPKLLDMHTLRRKNSRVGCYQVGSAYKYGDETRRRNRECENRSARNGNHYVNE